jgi:hypothetical protein
MGGTLNPPWRVSTSPGGEVAVTTREVLASVPRDKQDCVIGLSMAPQVGESDSAHGDATVYAARDWETDHVPEGSADKSNL